MSPSTSIKEEIASKLGLPYEVSARIGTEIVNIAIPSGRRGLVVIEIISSELRGGWGRGILGTDEEVAEKIIEMDEKFERIKRLKGPIACVGVIEELDERLVDFLEEVAYADEILFYGVDDISGKVREIATDPWYPTFVITRVRGIEILGIAPLGTYLKDGKLRREPRARGLIGIDPITENTIVINIETIINMMVRATKIELREVKRKELIELLRDPHVRQDVRKWSVERPEEVKRLLSEVRQCKVRSDILTALRGALGLNADV